jgi:hypothetical protein
VLRNQANFALDQDRCEDAVRFYRRALSVFEAVGDASAAGMVENDLGLMGQRCPGSDPIDWFQRALRRLQAAGDLPGVRKVGNNLGVAQLNAGRADEADAAFHVALSAATSLKDDAGQAKVLANLALTWVLAAQGARGDLMEIPEGTPELATARRHYRAGVAAARRAGQAERVVCDILGKYRYRCPLLAEGGEQPAY